MQTTRRRFIANLSLAGVGLLAGGCAKLREQEEVGAVEDLMREHGVLRRALLVYAETAPKLRVAPTPEMAAALQQTAQLFRSFGEDYHEKRLEETHIFPTVGKSNAALKPLTETLLAQHTRGRVITDYVLTVTQTPDSLARHAAELAGVLESFASMYENHAAREDTVVFPAWKNALTEDEREELGEKFEEIEHAQFGEDGFEQAVGRIMDIEATLGLAELSQFTPPPPPEA